MHVFSHSSKTDGGNDGLEFLSTRNDRNEVTEDGTISYDEISQLEKAEMVSKCKSSLTWVQYWSQRYICTVNCRCICD